MPFLGTITLEFCDPAREDASKEAVLEAAGRTPRDVDDWFLTLTRPNEDFLDCTMNDEATFHVHWCEGEKRFFSDAVDEALLVRLVDSYFENDGAWKTMCGWKERKKKTFLQKLFD